jgi:enamine deaminase RidA (YjgF/YER057c/UK114 family)
MTSDDKVYYTPKSHRWAAKRPMAAAVRAGDLLFISGQVSADANLKPTALGDVKAQARGAFANIKALLKEAGGTLDDIVDIMSFHKDVRDMDAVFDVGRQVFKKDYPAWTALGMEGTFAPEFLVSIRAIAHLGSAKKKCVTPKSMAWMKKLPMSAACRKGDYLFTSGIVSADAAGKVVSPGDHYAQARVCYDRLRDTLKAGGAKLDDIVDMICFNQDARGMDDAVNCWCNEVVPDLPVNQATSYTAIAMTGMYKIGMVGAYRAIVDFSEGPRVATNLPSVHWYEERIAGAAKKKEGRLIGISGQVASDGERNIIARGDPAAQARYCFGQIRGVLAKHGASMEDVVEITSFHKDPRAWQAVMQVGEEIWGKGRGPAWTPVGCTGLYLEGYLHEIYALAMV